MNVIMYNDLVGLKLKTGNYLLSDGFIYTKEELSNITTTVYTDLSLTNRQYIDDLLFVFGKKSFDL